MNLFFTVITLIVSALYLYGISQVSTNRTIDFRSILKYLYLYFFPSIEQKTIACMIPEIILNFIGIFVAIIFFIITLVWGINAVQSENGTNVKLQTFPIIILWFLLISKASHSIVHSLFTYEFLKMFCFVRFRFSCHVAFYCCFMYIMHKYRRRGRIPSARW